MKQHITEKDIFCSNEVGKARSERFFEIYGWPFEGRIKMPDCHIGQMRYGI